MEEEIKKAYSEIETELIEGRGGVFDIALAGRCLYSKRDPVYTEGGRFPVQGEAAMLVRKALGHP